MNNLKSTDSRVDWIRSQLTKALTPTYLEVIDQAWQHVGHAEEGAGHFLVRISSPQFTKRPLVDCHRLVYGALGDVVGKDIHALQLDILQ